MKIKDSWKDITISEFIKINEYIDIYSKTGDTVNFLHHVVALLTGSSIEEIENISINEFQVLSEKLSFIGDMPLPEDVKEEYIFAGKKYLLNGCTSRIKDMNVRNMKAIQYVDSLHLLSEMNDREDIIKLYKKLPMLLAVILEPENGAKYNDDHFSVSENAYIIENNMSIVDAMAIESFFLLQYKALTKISQHFSGKMLKN